MCAKHGGTRDEPGAPLCSSAPPQTALLAETENTAVVARTRASAASLSLAWACLSVRSIHGCPSAAVPPLQRLAPCSRSRPPLRMASLVMPGDASHILLAAWLRCGCLPCQRSVVSEDVVASADAASPTWQRMCATVHAQAVWHDVSGNGAAPSVAGTGPHTSLIMRQHVPLREAGAGRRRGASRGRRVAARACARQRPPAALRCSPCRGRRRRRQSPPRRPACLPAWRRTCPEAQTCSHRQAQGCTPRTLSAADKKVKQTSSARPCTATLTRPELTREHGSTLCARRVVAQPA